MGIEAEFGKELRRLRRSNPDVVSLADVADAIGCSVTYISAIERGDRNPPNNEKIKAILEFLGQEELYDKLLELAIKARKAVEIPVDGTNSQLTHALLGLARRSEEGLSDDDPLVAKLSELLEKDEEEKRCQTLFHGLNQNQDGKSNKKRRRS